MSKPIPGSYIDTQGMSGPTDPSVKSKPQEYKTAIKKPRRLFTSEYVKEMKILINEVLDEREGKSGVSYFDSEKFKHRINEPEPPYEEWK